MLFLIQSNSSSPREQANNLFNQRTSEIIYSTRESAYKFKIMNMAQLFKALPRDLQWDVLCEFLGTHSVRKGKLIRKIVYTTFQGKIFRQIGSDKYLRVKVAESVRARPCKPWLSSRPDDMPNPTMLIRLTENKPLAFWEDPYSGATIYLYRTMERDPYIPFWKIRFAPVGSEDSVVLPPFVKHEYPSYEYTDKKNALRIT